MVKQFAQCYAVNSRAAVPARLTLASLSGELAAGYTAMSGSDKWTLHRTAASYLDAFADRRADLVYLTADAEEELAELKAGDVYVVGGIVDRNRHKV